MGLYLRRLEAELSVDDGFRDMEAVRSLEGVELHQLPQQAYPLVRALVGACDCDCDCDLTLHPLLWSTARIAH